MTASAVAAPRKDCQVCPAGSAKGAGECGMDDPVAVLDYWLDEVGPDGWYAGGEALDSDCRTRWLDLWEAASRGGLELAFWR